MINNKKGVSKTLSVILMILIVLVMMTIVYLIVNYFMKKSEDNSKIKVSTTNVELEKSLIIIEKDTGKLQLHIKRDLSKLNISLIKAVVLGTIDSGSYLIFDIPKKNEPKTYVLNVSRVGDIREVLIYPLVFAPTGAQSKSNVLLKTDDVRISEIEIYPEYGKENIEYYASSDLMLKNIRISTALPVINPEQGPAKIDCISDWNCEEWDKCHALYDIDTVIEDKLTLTGEQTRLCKDNNECIDFLVDRRECDGGGSITIKTIIEGNKKFVEIFDLDDNQIAKLEFIEDEHSVLNIEIPVV